MLHSNLFLFWRSLRKTGLFTLINLSGLVIGMMAFLFIVHYVRFERSYEDFHKNADNIYRITLDLFKGSEYVATDCETHAPVGPLLKRTMPEVRDYVRCYSVDDDLEVVVDEHRVTTDKVFLADQSIFNVFTLNVVDGAAHEALSAPYQAVMTRSLAMKVFGNENAVGKSIEANRGVYKVTAVIEDLPPNTHLKMNLLLSHATLTKIRSEYTDENWRGNNEYTYLLMNEGTDLALFNAKLHELSKTLKDKIEEDRLTAEEIKSIHLYSNKTYEPEANGNAKVVYFMSVIAAFIIIIAWINYVNLATARSVERAREVGIRKVMGSQKWELVIQFFVEATLVNLVAAAVAMLFFRAGLPLFRDLTGLPLPMDILSDPIPWYVLGGLIAIGSISSGLYPAFVLSSFKPAMILKGQFQATAQGQWLRRGLVVVQFGITFLLIAALITVYSQIRHLHKTELGMNIDQVIAVPAPRFSGSDSTYLAGLSKFKTDLQSIPSVDVVGASGSLPGFDYNQISSTSFARVGHESEGNYEYYFHVVDGNYFKSMGMELVAGRFFEDGGNNDDQAILNETAARRLGFASPQEAIGQKIGFWTRRNGGPSEVIGVVADYYQRSPKESFIPMAYRYGDWIGFFTVKIKTADARSSMESVQQVFNSNFPDDTFQGYFIDDMYNTQYIADQQLGRVITSACLLAVFIACLGLFGLSAYTISQRTKEIGIRKVLGASVSSIVGLLTGSFLKLVAISGFIAVPLTYLTIREWLSNYANRIEIGPWLFILPMMLVLSIALVTVGLQTLRSAKANPVNSLRQE